MLEEIKYEAIGISARVRTCPLKGYEQSGIDVCVKCEISKCGAIAIRDVSRLHRSQ